MRLPMNHPVLVFAFLFADPLTQLLATAGAGAAAISIPIIIHLLNRKRYRVVQWAAMRFLLAAQRKNSRRMRLEQLILLAVRVMAVTLLVAAMACVMDWADRWVWPHFFPNGAGFAGSLGQQRAHKILVVDGSFSMGLRVGDGTCFDRARARAEQIVQESPRGDSFSVVLMAAPPRRIVSEPSEDARKVAAEIQNLRLPHGNADLLATLNAVEDLLRQSPGKFQEREVYFLTDMQQSTWVTGPLGSAAKESGTAAQGSLATLLQKIQTRAHTVFVDVGQETANNLAVTNLALGASLATPTSVTPITATIHNYGPDTREQVRVELAVGRARMLATDPPFEMRVAHQAVVKLNRGQNTVSFPYKFTSVGDYVVQVRLEGDALDLDDVRSAVVSVKSSVPVMLVNGKLVEGRPAGKLADDATEWLRIALNPFDTPAGGAGGLPARPKVVSENEFNDAGAGDLTPYDCVYLCDVKQFTLPEVRRLETHVRRGGGVVFCLGGQVDFKAYNDLLYKGGTGLLPAELKEKQAAPASGYFHLAVEEKAYQSPPLDAFADDNDRISLTIPRFRQYVRVNAVPPARGARKVLSFMPAPANLSDPRNVKAIEGLPVGDPAVLEWQPPLPPDNAAHGPDSPPRLARMRGRVVLITTPTNMDWSTWPAYRSFLPLMQELLGFAVSGRLREQAVTVSEPLEEYLQTAGGGLDATLHTPDGRTETVRTLGYEDVSVLRWADTDVSGVYRATIGQHPQDHLFAVNVPTSTDGQSASESDLTRTNADELHKTYPDWDFQLVTELKDVVHQNGTAATTAEAPRISPGVVLARWLLLAMLVLLLGEVVLAWQFGHYSTAAGTSGTPPATGKLLPGLIAAGAAMLFLAFGGVLLHAAWTGDFLSFLPEGSRRLLESVMGVAAPASGEGTRWRLEFNSFLWSASADPWLAGVVALAAGVLIYLVYRQEGQTAGAIYKLLLTGLRICLLLLTLAVLLPQLRLWFERQGWPDIAIILDDSASMSTVDRYQDPQVQAVADRLAQQENLSANERLMLAQALVANHQADWLTRLVTKHKVKVHIYHCSGRAHRIADASGADEVDHALQEIRDLRAEPRNDSSQLGTAVRQVINDFRGASLSSIIMLTDGVTTEGEDLVKVSHYAAQFGVPLYFVGIGDAHEMRDLVLHDLQAEDSVYVNDRIVFELKLTGHGYKNLTVPVRLHEKGSDKVLAEQQVTVDPQGKPVKVRLVHQPTEKGEKNYVIEVPVQPDETQVDDNKIERTVDVQDTRLFKVLYVEGYPRYEFRFVKTLLEREAARKGNKTIDLRVLLLDADADYPLQDKSALSEFPLKSDLNNFDVVLLGDVDPKHPKLGDKVMAELADFVKERGGGLLMIAGQRHAPWVYKSTALADVLPIDVVRDRPPEEPEVGRTEGFHPELTPMGRLHPIFRFSPDEHENDDIWNHLREIYWWADGYRVKPAAEVLAVHPSLKSEPNVPGREPNEKFPLVVHHFVGAGRCMFFGFDESWRWRWREDELRFNQFWIQTVRYLARSRLGRVELRFDRQTPYRRGEPIKITVRFPDDAAPPGPETEVKVVVERRPPRKDGRNEEASRNAPPLEVQTVQLARVEGSRSTYEGLLTRTPEGEFLCWLSAPAVSGPKPHCEGRVLAPPGELELLRMNQPDMEKAAEDSHGHFYTLAEADRVLDELPPGTRVTLNSGGPPLVLWNSTLVLLVAVGLLTSEWVLRKRKHLL
jgi:SAM-dependent methyltransferase